MRYLALVALALAVSGCSLLCSVPVLNSLPGVTCPTPAPTPGG